MKKLFLSMMLLAMPLLVNAYDCQVDGIYYNLYSNNKTAGVTFQLYDHGNYKSDYSGSVVIPEKITYEGVEYSVTSIDIYAFFACSSLTSVTIPNSVTSIGGYAFRGCSDLTSVTIGNSVRTIGNYAFQECSNLASVVIPNSVTTIGQYAFYRCNRLTAVHITDLEAWCKIAFGNYESNPLYYAHLLYLNGEEIKSNLAIPNSVTSIGNYAFSGCRGLTSVSIPNSVTTIGDGAFYYCRGLASVTIPNSVTSIGEQAFWNSADLTSITIPNSVTSIGERAFWNCRGLTSVTIPNSVTSIGEKTFSGCFGLTSVTIPNSVTTIGDGAFNGCSGLISLDIPNSVTSIENSAFSNCSGLTSVIIPNSVTSIGEWAFYNCSGLTSVTIGSSVISIGEWTFAECSKLEEVYCLAEQVPNTNTDAFEKSYPEYMTLYVPASALNAYKTIAPWSMFGTIKAIEGDETKCATPTISYADKELTFSCETEGAEFVSKITDADIKDFYGDKISLSATYEISVYATKSGYTNSDVATATLVWTDAIFTETTPDTTTSAKAVTESIPVLISANGGIITVKSEQEGQKVEAYAVNGQALGSATVRNGQASIPTNIQRGDIAIVKVGNGSVKIKM